MCKASYMKLNKDLKNETKLKKGKTKFVLLIFLSCGMRAHLRKTKLCLFKRNIRIKKFKSGNDKFEKTKTLINRITKHT